MSFTINTRSGICYYVFVSAKLTLSANKNDTAMGVQSNSSWLTLCAGQFVIAVPFFMSGSRKLTK